MDHLTDRGPDWLATKSALLGLAPRALSLGGATTVARRVSAWLAHSCCLLSSQRPIGPGVRVHLTKSKLG
jgi:hypothetical protein